MKWKELLKKQQRERMEYIRGLQGHSIAEMASQAGMTPQALGNLRSHYGIKGGFQRTILKAAVAQKAVNAAASAYKVPVSEILETSRKTKGAVNARRAAVVLLLHQGYSRIQIAKALGLSVSTTYRLTSNIELGKKPRAGQSTPRAAVSKERSG